VPIILLTGEESRDVDQAAIYAGAADYLIKGQITSALLERSIRHALERKHSQKSAQLLVDAGVRLAASLDYERTLESVGRLVAEHMADYCIIDLIDGDGELVRLSVSARDTASDEMAEWLGTSPLLDHPDCIVAQALASRRPVLEAEVDGEKVLDALDADDPRRLTLARLGPVSAMAAPLIARGQLFGAILFISVQSGHHYDQDDLLLAEQLAMRAALATDNARLYRDAQRAIEWRDEAHRMVAHDLRNPLSTVKMVAELLERTSPGGAGADELRKHLGVQKHAVAQMNRLIEDLLDTERIEAGHLSVEPLACAPRALITDVTHQHMAQAQERSIHLRSQIEDALPDIIVDADRIEQVFSNLLGNALKFTPRGGQIEVGARRCDEGVAFWVSDSGPGIAAEQFPYLFDRFWQADKVARHGAGLGLAIAKGIVEAHQGKIWVESQPGQGAAFCFELPIAGQ
jgi:signal transduction histidine kinase